MMRLDIIDIDPETLQDTNEQEPTAIRFTYATNASGTTFNSVIYAKNPVDAALAQGDTQQIWPKPGDAAIVDPNSGITTPAGNDFPFHVERSATRRLSIVFYADRLQKFLANELNTALPDTNNSISINPNYLDNSAIIQPSFPAANNDMRVILAGTRDLTSFTGGFSLVTNLRLILEDDINVVTTTTIPTNLQTIIPAGSGYKPAISLFAPETRYGNNASAVKVTVNGQLTSLARNNNQPTRIGDLKSEIIDPSNNTRIADVVEPTQISGTLDSIDHPGFLPPINTFNWMVVVREIHTPTAAVAPNN